MGLDVYVGSLTRYYLGAWETIVPQAGRERGFQVSIERPFAPKQNWFERFVDRFRPKGTAAATRAVRRWQRQVARELRVPNLEWNEDREAEYETDKPAWDCYGALVLWAAYEELPSAHRRHSADGWEEDPAYAASRGNPQSKYRHLVADTQIWLPIEFDPPLATRALTGEPIVVGSSLRLLEELKRLNSCTWAATDQQIREWRYEGVDGGSSLKTSARFGFSIFFELAQRSVAARLPMKLDY
jgi:hypothetical protein